MILLDAYALVAFLRGEPASLEVRALLREPSVGLTTVNLAEAVDVLARRHRVEAGRARPVIEALMASGLVLVPLEARQSWRAGQLRSKHYDRARRPLSLADCMLLASAREGDRVATADRHVLEVAKAEGVGAIALPAAP